MTDPHIWNWGGNTPDYRDPVRDPEPTDLPDLRRHSPAKRINIHTQGVIRICRTPNEKAMHKNRVSQRLAAKKAKKAQTRKNRK